MIVSQIDVRCRSFPEWGQRFQGVREHQLLPLTLLLTCSVARHTACFDPASQCATWTRFPSSLDDPVRTSAVLARQGCPELHMPEQPNDAPLCVSPRADLHKCPKRRRLTLRPGRLKVTLMQGSQFHLKVWSFLACQTAIRTATTSCSQSVHSAWFDLRSDLGLATTFNLLFSSRCANTVNIVK